MAAPNVNGCRVHFIGVHQKPPASFVKKCWSQECDCSLTTAQIALTNKTKYLISGH